VGLDVNEMTTLALNQGKFNHIRSQIKGNFDEETLEYIKNLAEIDKNGQGVITINGQSKALSSLTETDANAIKNESERKAERNAATMGDIFVHTKGISETLDDLFKYITTNLGRWVAKIAGVKFSDEASRGYWKNLDASERRELRRKYGGGWLGWSNANAKLALGMGEATELVDKALSKPTKEGEARYDSGLVKDFIEYKLKNDKSLNAKNVYRQWENGENGIENEFKQWANSNSHITNVPLKSDYSSYNTQPLIKNASNENAQITNINENTFNPMTVNPTKSVGAEKVEVNPFSVDVSIGGKIDLTSGDKSKTVDITKLSQTDIDKLTSMIYKQVYTEISKKIERGFDKENYPFRGA
jgi:hypothetical protein